MLGPAPFCICDANASKLEGYIETNRQSVEISLKFVRDQPGSDVTTRIQLNKENLGEICSSLYLDNCVKDLLLRIAEKSVSDL